MKTKTSRMAACAFILLLFLTHGMMAHGQLQPGTGKRPAVKIIYGALTTSNAPIWIGADQGFYEKYGLDVTVVHGRGASPILALAGGTVEIGHFAGASVVAANLGGSDLVFVGAQTNYVVLSIWTRPRNAKNSFLARRNYRASVLPSESTPHHAQFLKGFC